MLLNRVDSDEMRVSAVPSDIGCRQPVNDLGEGEKRKLGGERVRYCAGKCRVVFRAVIDKRDTGRFSIASQSLEPRRDGSLVGERRWGPTPGGGRARHVGILICFSNQLFWVSDSDPPLWGIEGRRR